MLLQHTQIKAIDVLTNLLVVIISRYVCVSSHCVEHLKLTQCCISIIYQ